MKNETSAGVDPDVDVDELTDEQALEMLEKISSEASASPDEAAEPEENEQAEVEQGTPAKAEAQDEEQKPETSETTTEDASKPAKQDSVPFARFEHERNRRKSEEEALAAMREQNAVLNDRLERLVEATQVPQQAQENTNALPGPDDPVGRINMLAERAVEQDRINAENQKRAQEEAAYQQEVAAAYQQANAEFSAGGEEVQQAYMALKASYRDEFSALGYSQAQAAQEYPAIEAQHLLTAKQRGVPIADYIKGLASARGWRYAPQQQEAGAGPAQDANPAPGSAPVHDKELTRQKALSLGAGGGTSVQTGEITPEQLLNMPEKDFAEYLNKHRSVSNAMGFAPSSDW